MYIYNYIYVYLPSALRSVRTRRFAAAYGLIDWLHLSVLGLAVARTRYR